MYLRKNLFVFLLFFIPILVLANCPPIKSIKCTPPYGQKGAKIVFSPGFYAVTPKPQDGLWQPGHLMGKLGLSCKSNNINDCPFIYTGK